MELERVVLRRKPLPHTMFLCDTPTLLPLGLPDSVAKPASRAQHAAVSAADERASAPAACGRSGGTYVWLPKVSGKDQGVRDPGLSGERDPKINSH